MLDPQSLICACLPYSFTMFLILWLLRCRERVGAQLVPELPGLQLGTARNCPGCPSPALPASGGGPSSLTVTAVCPDIFLQVPHGPRIFHIWLVCRSYRT